MIAYDSELRTTLAGNIAAHTRHTVDLDGRRHAAVAIVIVDSDAERDGVDDSDVDIIDLSVIPSDVTGLDGRMNGVAGGASFLLCRRAAGLRAHSRQWALPGGRCDPGETVERNVMTLDLFDGGPPIHGFLLGAIAFYQGTILGRRKVHGMGFTQSLASKIGILLSVLRVLWYGPGDKSGFHGERVALSLDGQAAAPQDLFLLVATTLTGILPGIKPFWGQGPGPIRVTTISHPPRRFAWAALPALRGKPKPWMEAHGYCSYRADQLECDLVTPVVFDGEFLETDGGPGLRLSVGPKITFTRY